MDERIIGHIDMDAFFASVEERDKPWLKGLPVVVGADPDGGYGRGVVATANYAARRYGISSALPIGKAWRLSEEARMRGEHGVVFLSPHGRRYSEVSKQVFAIASRYARELQITSIDEAYFDMTHAGSYECAKEAVLAMKRDILERIHLTCSVGLGPNKMVAKIASDHDKPDGLTVVPPDSVVKFLAPLPIRTIPGIGPKTGEHLRMFGIHTISDARSYSWEELYDMLGSYGFAVYQKIWGAGSTDLSSEHVRKSIGKHETFFEDIRDLDLARLALLHMAESIMRNCHRKGFKGFRTIVLTVRFADFETRNRSLTTKEDVHDPDLLYVRALKLLLPFFEATENPAGKAIRMLGLRVEKLV